MRAQGPLGEFNAETVATSLPLHLLLKIGILPTLTVPDASADGGRAMQLVWPVHDARDATIC